MLEKPLDQFLEYQELEMPFCICWANENWTLRWDGLESEILIEQIHSPENDINFITDLELYFRDPRYIRIDGKPILIMYRAAILPDPKATTERWRASCKELGIGDIFIIAAQTFGFLDPREYGFDGAVEFPPHTMGDCNEMTYWKTILNPRFSGTIWDYENYVKSKTYLGKVPYLLFKGIIPRWDNTPRKPNNPSIYHGSNPLLYKEWLLDLMS